MRFFWQSVVKDLRRKVNDPYSLALWLAIPLFIGIAITLATGGSGGTNPTAVLLVADEDESLISGLFKGVFNQGELSSIIQLVEVTREEGLERIEEGKGSGFLVLPQGFGEAVLLENPLTLTLITNPAQQILPSILEETLGVIVDGTFYLHRILGEQLKTIAETSEDPSDSDVAEISVAINQKMQKLSTYLFPPVIQLDSKVDEQEDTQTINFGLLFLPGVILMALFFTAQGMAEDIWKERQLGTLLRVNSLPPGLLPFLLGKLAAGGALLAAISLVGLTLGMWYHSIGFSGLPLAVVWSSISGVLLLLLLLSIQLYARSQKAAGLISNGVTFPLLMLGGSFFPSEVMPGWMGAVGRWTPNGLAVERLKDILLDRAQPGEFIVAFMVYLGLSLVLLNVSLRRLRRGFM